jgi:8-oxo-dGTP pyrophosphatase MutT (NUDIX family)
VRDILGLRKTMTHKFFDANGTEVPYHGEQVSWRVSAYALVIQNDAILLVKSRIEKLYDVVGGGIEIGETIEETIAREAMEEAGAVVKLGALAHVHQDWFYHRKGTYHQTLLLFYLGTLAEIMSQPSDPNMEKAQFVRLDQLGKYPLAAYVREAIAAARTYETSVAKSAR